MNNCITEKLGGQCSSRNKSYHLKEMDRAALLLSEATADTRRDLEPGAQRPYSHTSSPHVRDPLRGKHHPGLSARGYFYSEVELFLGGARTPHSLPPGYPLVLWAE